MKRRRLGRWIRGCLGVVRRETEERIREVVDLRLETKLH